ncbi:Aste57867_24412 [Aphanomyces stellatus]|uniref:Probable acetate kinase n=1 Tax=Aphanomyces stellatus TaxID=120398 RepID=A0A485LS90_9STRA|nr:hypothetical protein As57867_024336 [Aphanomyces stellatus]VFU01052.1 Aste57867_24412 [Aphanomyces stellatus]
MDMISHRWDSWGDARWVPPANEAMRGAAWRRRGRAQSKHSLRIMLICLGILHVPLMTAFNGGSPTPRRVRLTQSKVSSHLGPLSHFPNPFPNHTMDKLKILVLNAGSSSLKYKLFSESRATLTPLISGMVELGKEKAVKHATHTATDTIKASLPPVLLKDHKTALSYVIDLLTDPTHGGLKSKSEIGGIGHRVVHGGEAFSAETIISNEVIQALEDNIDLAPLHNPANILGIQVAQELFDCKHVAVFDTAFHATIPPAAYLYGLPYSLYEKYGVRRYGFHGTSHKYVAQQAAKHLGKPFDACNFVTLHLGNGASMSAIRNGKCIDTSMGFTPLEGLVMGSRSGDIDAAILPFLHTHANMSLPEMDMMLNKKSGLLGLCGDADVRTIQTRMLEGDKQADLALDVFSHRVRKYLGAYVLQLYPKVDGIIFTAGIGEQSSILRQRICANLGHVGIELDDAKNEAAKGADIATIESASSAIPIFVVPTDEELSIAQATKRLLHD